MSSSSGRLKAGSFFVIDAIVVSQVVEPPGLDDNGKTMSSSYRVSGYASLEIAYPQRCQRTELRIITNSA